MLAQIIDRNDEDTGLIVPWTDPEYGCDLIYDYDSTAKNPRPTNLRRSWESKLRLELHKKVMQDLDDDITYKPTSEELTALYSQKIASEND